VSAGDRGALARALTILEAGPGADALLDQAFRRSGSAFRVGFTGPPGAGKSTLIAEVALRYRQLGHRVGILAVDPTSPFTGGALLGDRIRMGPVAGDPDVFVRSMASRGHRGGLAATAVEAADLLEMAGFDRVVIETVGVGQGEIEVAGAAHQVVVVLVPEAGDAVQSLKAGLTEIGDVMVVNKADRPGAEAMAAEVRDALELRGGGEGPPPPVLLTEGTSGRGVDELVEALEASAGTPTLRSRARRVRAIRAHLIALVMEGAERRLERTLAAELEDEVSEISNGRTTPRQSAERLLARFLEG
jgi:LAO/AO transport system kinase